MRLALAFLLAGAFARADSLSDLRGRLATAAETAPVTATITYASSRIGGEPADPVGTTATVVATDGPEGLQLRWPGEVLRGARAAGGDDEQRRRAREAIDELKPSEVYEYLNITASLAEVLSRSELVAERSERWRDRPARRLELKLTVPLSEKDRKYIKELTAQATVWLDEAGWPLAAERKLHVKGRAMLVISFEQRESETYEFGHVAGRLVVLRHEKTSEGSGGGERGGRKTVATLEVTKA